VQLRVELLGLHYSINLGYFDFLWWSQRTSQQRSIDPRACNDWCGTPAVVSRQGALSPDRFNVGNGLLDHWGTFWRPSIG
jgi:hypothetical protein